MLTAQEAYRRTDTLIGTIDRTVRARFSAELMSRGPSPLLPATWLAALEELGAARRSTIATALRDRVRRPGPAQQALRRLPINLLLIAAGLGLAFMVRDLAGGLDREPARRQPDRGGRRRCSWRCAT